MLFKIEFSMDSPSFKLPKQEIAFILGRVASAITDGISSGPIFDSDKKIIGRFEIKSESAKPSKAAFEIFDSE